MHMRLVSRLWGLAVVVAVLALFVSLSGKAAEPNEPRRPESVQVTVTDGGYAIRPQFEAGRYQLVIENLSGQDVALELVRAPYGGTAEQPHLDSQAGVVVFAGSAKAHSRGRLTVDLLAGEWIVRNAQSDEPVTAFSVGTAG